MKFYKPLSHRASTPVVKKKRKRLTVQGQSIPMSEIVKRYTSGQIFGLSGFEVSYDIDGDFDSDFSDDNYSDVENSVFIPDPSDPLAYENAELFNAQFVKSLKKSKDGSKMDSKDITDVKGDLSVLKEETNV